MSEKRLARRPTGRSTRETARAFTLIELIMVIFIMSFLFAIGIVHFRNSRATTTNLASNITFHMEFLRAATKLQELLQTGSEIVKPIEGRTLPYLIFRDILNQTQILYLETSENAAEKPAILVNYTDTYDGKYDESRKKTLFGKVRSIEFTTNSLGVVVVNLSLINPKEKAISSMIEIPFKNFGTVEGE